ncbi:histone-lysine N-methyltransferase SETD5 isoform X2 [Conger conger]|uniref:histone-lysine N-methyltransferase SETD5 isoform X2 n=1 Tax=Conger conger TaxID=82655 RepID=UPI002A59D819|nr:histone-lysine N-methyltransferase SETD5 isoform X2 [Conger conger]
MSIVIALGVTTPETSYSDMAAGSDPESVEASPAVNEKNYSNHSCGSAQNHGYRGLPYADHNYGAPPPPTPPASPLSQTIIPRVELNGVMCSRYHDDNSADSDSSSDEEGGVASWCPCSLRQDGFLIKCENCRGLDRRKGVDTPRRKPENVSVGESSATESGDEEVSPSTVSYTATQHTPTSITLTVNRIKRNKPKKRKKSTEKARSAPKGKKIKAFREGSRKSMRMKNSTTEASTLDENTAEGWETRIRQWTDQYEEAFANQYSADVQTLLQLHRAASKASEGKAPTGAAMDTINRTELACNNTVIGSQMQLQLGRVTRVQKHRKILRAARDLDPDTLIIEYRGKVMLKQQFEVNGHFFKKPYPFVLFYSKFNEVEMCVDARTFGNDARFIRRSCTPNAEVRHMIAEGMIHLCIYAVTHITKDCEVTIGFDYEFNSCNYKVDCACHKGNQNCPVQKHNLSPPELPLRPPSLPAQPGAETRRRKARRKELEGGVSDDSNQQPEDPADAKATSDTEERDCDGLKLEDGEEAELEEGGALLQSRRTREDQKAEAIMHVFENLEKRKKRSSQSQGAAAEEPKQEGQELEEDRASPTGSHTAQSGGVGVSTRRASYITEVPPTELEKAPSTPAASKPAPARSSKPRPKSRMSRYRSSSSQRARRQRQALAQQAAEQGQGVAEEGTAGAAATEPGVGEGALGGGQPLDTDGLGGMAAGALGNKAQLRYPKTKKYLVTEWLNDKVLEKPECPVDRPLRITTDPTVLATTLNMLPGLSHSPLICTTPKHYVRFGSPFTPERRRRPVSVDASYGSFKKRWIKQAQDESTSSANAEDGTESNCSHQSNSSGHSTSNPFQTELTAPYKKRKSKYASEPPPLPSADLLRPLSPITPPLTSDPTHPLLASSCSLILGTEDERHNGYSLPYSPQRSLSTSRCNTPLQFENISSPEGSPVHRPESLSPEPCLCPDYDVQRPAYPDPPLPAGLESPALPACPLAEDFAPVTPEPPGAAPLPPAVATAPPESQAREQAFRTEFNLIYTCSPLNANLGEGLSARGPTADRRPSQSEAGGFSPAEPFFGGMGGQGLLSDAVAGSLSPYAEPHYSGSYPDHGTPPHPSNPPQKKKVSLLEYRKRKQGAKDPEVGGSLGTPTRPSVFGSSADSPGGPRALLQPPASPQSCFSSPPHPSAPQIEEVSPPDHTLASQSVGALSRSQDSTSHWMVPTSVERLRENQGVLERVLRGGLKMERMLKREGAASDSSRDKDSDSIDGDLCEVQSVSRTITSPVKSPQRYRHSPSVYQHQSMLLESHQQGEPAGFIQHSASSPFRGSYSPSAPSPGQGFYPRLSSLPPIAQDPSLRQSPSPSSSYPSHAPSGTVGPSADPALCGASRQIGGAPSGSSSAGGLGMEGLYGGSHLKASLLNSGTPVSSGSLSRSPLLAQSNPKTDPSAGTGGSPVPHASRVPQQPAVRTLSPSSPGTRLLPAPSTQPYPQRGAPISQFQHTQIQGSGVRTQSGSY